MSEKKAWAEIARRLKEKKRDYELGKLAYFAPHICFVIEDLLFEGKISNRVYDRLRAAVEALAKKRRKSVDSDQLWATGSIIGRVRFCEKMARGSK